LSELFLIDTDLLVDLLLEFLSDPFFFFALIDLPALSFLLDFKLVLLDDFLLLEFEVAINFFD